MAGCDVNGAALEMALVDVERGLGVVGHFVTRGRIYLFLWWEII